jgi:hypothetical protein
MDKISFIEIETLDGVVTHAIIDRGTGEFTSMTKEHYDSLPTELTEPAPMEKPKK